MRNLRVQSLSFGSFGESTGLSDVTIYAIAGGSVLFVLIVICCACYCCKREKDQSKDSEGSFRPVPSPRIEPPPPPRIEPPPPPHFVASTPADRIALFRDEDITSTRIPIQEIMFGKSLAIGGLGQVLRGSWKGEDVAIKQLLPNIVPTDKQIEAFLNEAKRCIMFTHASIVTYYGVAWMTGADVCIIQEFMAGGDLRSYLDKRDQLREPQGFNSLKLRMALNVAQALEYLHMQNVIHRDVRSRNVVLTQALEARLTDFGVSRERADEGMTRQVGTWRWMAPEIINGSAYYDQSADMWGFGIVLSELDTHLMPYAHLARMNTPDFLAQQQIQAGKTSVEFSQASIRNVPDSVQLGRDCVSLNPAKRPSSKEARRILEHDFSPLYSLRFSRSAVNAIPLK